MSAPCHELTSFLFRSWYNVTNQPLFSVNTSVCDNFVRLLNTSVSEAPYAPEHVRGLVQATTPYFAKTTSWESVYGLKLDQAFYEIDNVPCESLKGFSVAIAPSSWGAWVGYGRTWG